MAVACTAPPSDKPPVFGGEGAAIEDNSERPLPPASSDETAELEGPCAKAAPPGTRVELDDFEDADSKIFKVFEREGWWYTATDGTEGQSVSPSIGAFKPVPLPEEEATQDNEYAAHLTASGQKDWGVVWGTTLKWTHDGIGCPFNGSRFAGVEFRAKGPATVWVNFNTPGVTPKENGGTCKERCWDSYGKLVRLKEGWHTYTVRWNQLQQQGWGADVRFHDERLMNLNFSVKPEHLPTDFWIDDIRFLSKDGQKPVASVAKSMDAGEEGTDSTPQKTVESGPSR